MIDTTLEPVISSFLESTPSVTARIQRLKAEVHDRIEKHPERGDFTLPRYDINNLFTVEQFMQDLGIIGTGNFLMDTEELVQR